MFKNLFLKSSALFIGLFLLIFLAVPIFQVFYVSFLDQNGHFTLLNFYDFFQNALFIESFYNSFLRCRDVCCPFINICFAFSLLHFKI